MKKADHQLVQQVLDGAVTADEFRDFQERMRREPGMFQLYGEYAMVHHTLCEELEHQTLSADSAASVRPRRGVRLVWWGIVAAAAVIFGSALIDQNWSESEALPENLGRVSFSEDAVWTLEGPSVDPDELVRGSVLRLQQGQAKVSLGEAGIALLESPSVLRIEAATEVNLVEGRGFFRTGNAPVNFKVHTPLLSVVERGAEFGLEALVSGYVALHVIDGRIEMWRKGEKSGAAFSAGEGLGISTARGEERFAADASRFRDDMLQFRQVFGGPMIKADWRVAYGSPLLEDGGITGENFSAFCRISPSEPAGVGDVFLASLEVGDPSVGEFHTEGWSGMSLFQQGEELIFFGDTFGMDGTWSLDVKQRHPVIMPKEKVSGAKTVTLRYQKSTGDVSLHEGIPPLRSAFCRGKLRPGVEFDEVRLGASAGAALDVRSLTIRIGAYFEGSSADRSDRRGTD
jgi:hypothetical protein